MNEFVEALRIAFSFDRVANAAFVAILGYPLYQLAEITSVKVRRILRRIQEVRVERAIPDAGMLVRGFNNWAVGSDLALGRQLAQEAAAALRRLELARRRLDRSRLMTKSTSRDELLRQLTKVELAASTLCYAVEIVDPQTHVPSRQTAAQNLEGYFERVPEFRPTTKLFGVALKSMGADAESMQYQVLSAARNTLPSEEWRQFVESVRASGSRLAPAGERFIRNAAAEAYGH